MWVLSGWFALALLFRLVGREEIVVTDTELTSTIVILGLRRTRRFPPRRSRTCGSTNGTTVRRARR